VSNYGHDLWSGHFYEYMKIYGNLMRFAQDGVEAVNLDLKIRFLKHSQRGKSIVDTVSLLTLHFALSPGGAKGGKKGGKGYCKYGDRVEGLVNWVCR
jgi:hypothetical protein